MEKVISVYKFIMDRWSEPSTQASLSAMFLAAGIHFPDTTISYVLNSLGIVFGVVGVFMKEGTSVVK